MLSPDDYKAALDIVSNLVADYIHTANIFHIAPNTPEGKEWRQKSLYITMMGDLLSSMNGIRQIVRESSPTKTKLPNIYNPDNG